MIADNFTQVKGIVIHIRIVAILDWEILMLVHCGNAITSQPSLVKQIRGCCLKTQIALELEQRAQDFSENAQFDKKSAQFIDFYHLNLECSCKKKIDT